MMSGSAPGRLALTLMVGKFDARQAGDRQKRIGHRADQEQSNGQQRGADRPADERVARNSWPAPGRRGPPVGARGGGAGASRARSRSM